MTMRAVPCAPVRGAAWACPRSVLRGGEGDRGDRFVAVLVVGQGAAARVRLGRAGCQVGETQRVNRERRRRVHGHGDVVVLDFLTKVPLLDSRWGVLGRVGA